MSVNSTPEVSLIRASLFSSIAGLAHGFSTRHGGVSQGDFATLNLSLLPEESADRVFENRKRVCVALERPNAHAVCLRQVHGTTLHRVDRSTPSDAWVGDAMWTDDAAVMLSILAADCVPLLVSNSDGSAVLAIHAGWRGTAQRIVTQVFEALPAPIFEPKRCRAVLGPSIGPRSFEIGLDTFRALELAHPGAPLELLPVDNDGIHRADLRGLLRWQLLGVGFEPENVQVLPLDTVTDPRFFSHRRDAGRTGRQAGLIAPCPPNF